jgi:hypothetical protein
MELVVNEWLPEYFKPDATHQEKRNLETFLYKFLDSKDMLVVRNPCEFLRKIYRYGKDYQNNTKTYNLITNFIKLILQDSERCRFINDNDFVLPEPVRNKLVEGGNTVSDTYLFEAASATENKLIITTDVKLKTLMNNFDKYKVELLDTFLTAY